MYKKVMEKLKSDQLKIKPLYLIKMSGCDGYRGCGQPSLGEASLKKTLKTGQFGRRLLMKDDPRQKTIFDGRQLLMEEDLWWKTTFDGRRPLPDDDL